MFNKNKKKIDSRIRFQNSRFRSKLRTARGYKRTNRILPETDWEILLSKIGLGSWLSRIITILVFFSLIYIVFIPNFLFIKQITVNGASATINSDVKNLTESYLSKNLPWPQKNLALISKSALKNYLLKKDQEILSVDGINKHFFPAVLTLSITPRVDRFLIETASSTTYTVSGDGIVTNEIIQGASSTLPSLPILIKLNSGSYFAIGQSVLSQSQIGFINQLQSQIAGIVGSSIDYYKLDDLKNPDLTVYTKSGLKLIFDLSSDFNKALSQLRLLFSQFAPGDAKRLYYIDMRFRDKSYVCYKNTPCVAALNLPTNPTASSTPN